ncbi:hypothetical protein HXX76_002390 [Chlamydomonas incerta]|uniref:Uncharacterized protein n=1 Tax=Chlamydomonas incerta TaxID=51695 RepID=A0A835W912_CHLIN|nr:hypothetical protein HXX76_002390 [Chlamydomonas incerta]|eukprot:KAG2442304.1 hypothetical protein HXX76_002390 [Chlamydomonas incerta]
MLKLQPRSWDALPRLTAIEVSIRAIETKLQRDVVEKSDLLLYALALEVLAGKSAGFTAPANKALGTRATGVAVRLDAVTEPEAAYLFMEKLVHVLLPNQVGFEGVAPPTLVPPPRRSRAAEVAQARKAVLDHRKAPMKEHSTEFNVGNLLTYPDFEQNFSLFEPLRGMRVRLVMEGASAADCAALLGGLSLPLLSGAAAEAALAAIAAEAARRVRG